MKRPREHFAGEIQQRFGWPASLPEYQQTVELAAAVAPLTTARPSASRAPGAASRPATRLARPVLVRGARNTGDFVHARWATCRRL